MNQPDSLEDDSQQVISLRNVTKVEATVWADWLRAAVGLAAQDHG